jgi:hypothetical protein
MKNNISRFIKKATPVILSIGATIGVIGTAISAAKDYERIKNELDNRACNEITKKDIPIILKNSIPTISFSVGTIACIWSSFALNKKANVALMGAYGILANSFKKYREEANEVFGEDANNKIRSSLAQKRYNDTLDGYRDMNGKLILDDSEKEKSIFYIPEFDILFESSTEEVLSAFYRMNNIFQENGYVTINQLLKYVGAPEYVYGETIGWCIDDFFESGLTPFIDFYFDPVEMTEDGLICYLIGFPVDPSSSFMK